MIEISSLLDKNISVLFLNDGEKVLHHVDYEIPFLFTTAKRCATKLDSSSIQNDSFSSLRASVMGQPCKKSTAGLLGKESLAEDSGRFNIGISIPAESIINYTLMVA